MTSKSTGSRLPNDYPFGSYVIYGPYLSRKEKRKIVVLVGKEHRTTMSYARYLACIKEGRWLEDDEHADHIDNDKTNDDSKNIQVLSALQNIRKSAKGQTMIPLLCGHCENPFVRRAGLVHPNTKTYYCSRNCVYQSQRK